jgi:hypothetical protein
VSAREGTPLPSGPVRFALEAGFIILVGVIAAVLRLSAIAIVIVMGLAWVVVTLAERAAKSAAARPRRPRERAARPVAMPAAEEPPEPLLEPEPAPESRRRRLFSEPPSVGGSTDATPEWNLWELERRAREHAGADAIPEEWAAIFMHLREFANSDGRLPAQFDSLVRESFPELTRVG